MRIVLGCLGCLLIFCTAPLQTGSSKVDSSLTGVSESKSAAPSAPVSTKAETPAEIQAPQSYTVDQWIEKCFIILPKQEMFKKFGYELYLSKEMDKSAIPVDTALELRNHRLRCDKFESAILVVKSVNPLDSEWQIQFYDSLHKKDVFALTHKGAHKEIAFKNDIDSAKKRWVGRMVYSKRGLVSIAKDKNGFGSQKVLIQDSLRVTDVVWGVTPLPVNPIWLIVESTSKTSGFIPIRVSWTNTMSDLPKNGVPWDEDILESNPLLLHNWDQATWETVNNHKVIIGMTREQVLLSWGKPIQQYSKEVDGTTSEYWRYQSQTVQFGKNAVVTIINN